MHSIVIADSRALCREALCQYIRHAEQGYTVLEAKDRQSLQACLKENPDIVLIERNIYDATSMKDFDGRSGLIVSDMADAQEIPPGIMGVFPKTLSCKELLAGIENMLADRKFFPRADNVIALQENVMPLKRPTADFNLTQREKEVLSYLIKGASNKEIARALDLQVVTIKLHVRGICRKIKAQNRTQAALIAIENGWG